MGRPKGIIGESHGMTGKRPYRIWRRMRERCENKNHKFYKDYGGRGLNVAKEWLSFNSFWKDMGGSYFEGATLDRIDNDKGYSKDNCRWFTRREQMHNRRDNIYLTFNGVRKRVGEWAEEVGINVSTLKTRIRKGLSDEEVLTKKLYG